MTVTRDARFDLYLAGVRLADIARDPTISTPCYVYDVGAMEAGARALSAAFDAQPHLVAYAVKANTAGTIVRAFAQLGCGADVVSGGELEVALRCGVAPSKVVFSGVAKSDEEIDQALAAGIGAVQIESIEEVERVAARAKAAGKTARVALRINPAVDLAELDTHSHIATGHDEAKFGVPRNDVQDALAAVRAHPSISLVGLTCHVGSQFTTVDPYVTAARVLFGLVRDVRASGVSSLTYVSPGGGFGIDYGAGPVPQPASFVREARGLLREFGLDDLALYCEPGRSLVAAHGVLLARVIQTKEERHPPAGKEPRRWVMIDAGMNDLLRPALYQALHRIEPLTGDPSANAKDVRVVGPVCESSDDFGVHRLPLPAASHVVLRDAGAYGYTMASRYNGRALPAEVFLRDGRIVHVTHRKPPSDWVDDRVGS